MKPESRPGCPAAEGTILPIGARWLLGWRSGNAALLLLLFAVTAAAADLPVSWMIYPYVLDERMSDAEFARLRDSDCDLVGIQLFLDRPPSDLLRRRADALRASGKKIVLQIWWGPHGNFSWERYNLPAIALDPKVREDFFTNGVDPLIEAIGVDNLYAAHLLEESGMQFGFDVDIPGRPDDLSDGYDNGVSFDNPANWSWSRGISGPNVLSIRRWAEVCRRDTGLEMAYHPIWTGEDDDRYRRWVQERLEAGTHNAFKEHARKRWPGLKIVAFNNATAAVAQAPVLDGQFADPYSDTAGVYAAFRNLRQVMRPEQELIGMVWGNRHTEPLRRPRLPQMAAAWAAGCNVLSTFGDKEHQDDEWLATVRATVAPFRGLPALRPRSPLLLLAGGKRFGASLRRSQFWVTGFAWYDVATEQTLPAVKLDDYRMVVAWGMTHPGLADWVRGGGVLVSIRPGEDFLAREGILGPAPVTGPHRGVEYWPDPWLRERFGLREHYRLELDYLGDRELNPEAPVRGDGLVYVVEYGEGLVVTTPTLPWVHDPWEYEAHWEDYRRFLLDLCRGALLHRDERELADRVFCDPEKGHDYLRIPAPEQGRTVYILLIDAHGDHGSQTRFTVPGHDRISGRRDATLCNEHPVIVIEEAP